MAQHVKNADLRNEIIECKKNDELSEKALNMFILMSKKYATKYSFRYPEDKDDCIQSAVIDCYKYWRGYDPEISENAFAYYSTFIRNGFGKAWRQLYGGVPQSKMLSLSNNTIYNI